MVEAISNGIEDKLIEGLLQDATRSVICGTPPKRHLPLSGVQILQTYLGRSSFESCLQGTTV